jgi:hypothetical protein
MSLLSESKRFDDFTPEEKRQIFNIFTQSYVKATGSSWDENKFYSRANQWLFFGDPTGFVTVRPQQSGYYKLTGVAGNIKSIMKALQELTATHYPIWGMLTQELANILTKRYGFRMPNRVESFIIGKLISNNVFGNVEHKRNPDGSITFNYADVGESTKVFVGNREYYKKARLDAVKKVFSPTQPVNEEAIDEKRAVEHHYEDSFKTLVGFLTKFGYDNTYSSFRQTINTGFINRHNNYDTPTGFYMYPLKSFKEQIAKVTNMKQFMNIFPFTPDSLFAFIFTLENTQNILFSSNPDVARINGYVKQIKKKYGKKPSIKMLCDKYFNIEDTYKSRISNEQKYKNEFQKFWLFIYEIAFELRNPENEYNSNAYFVKYPAVYTKICNELNIDGFIDDGCLGIIFPNEPCQGVLFKNLRENTANLKIIPIYQKYDVAPNIDNSNNDNKNNVNPREYKIKYEKYLAKKLNVSNVMIVSDDYSILIKNRSPFMIMTNNLPYYVDKEGNKTVNGVNTEEIFKNTENPESSDAYSSERTAYFNTLHNENFSSVDTFGRFGDDTAYANKNETGGSMFINKEGKPDISKVEPDRINDGYIRAVYFNQLLGEKKFDRVSKFTDYGGEIALATLISSGDQVFINKKGNEDISNVDITKIFNTAAITTMINQKLGDEIYRIVNKFNMYGNGVALATQMGGRMVFIDINGKPTLENVDFNRIDNAEVRAIYFNQNFGKLVFSRVESFSSKLGDGVFLGFYYGMPSMNDNGGLGRKLININGEPDLTNVLFDKIQDTGVRAVYINQKYGTLFQYVERFDEYGENVALATDANGKKTFIDNEGKPNIGNVDINKIKDDVVRATFINTILGSSYKRVTSFNDFGEDVAYATTADETVFINREGKPDVSNVNLDKLRDRYMMATYFNQKFGTEYLAVYNFGLYSKDVALALTKNNKNVFINKLGEPDLTGIILSDITDTKIRATYFNQKTNKDYYEVLPFGQFGKGVALAKENSGKRTFINSKGQNSTATVDVEKIQDRTIRAAYFNQKYKTDYNTVDPFGNFSKDITYATKTVNNYTKGFFINREGKPDISDVDVNKFTSDTQRTTYFNQKFGTNYNGVVIPSAGFDKVSILFAQIPVTSGSGSKYIILNSIGQPTIDDPDIEKLKHGYSLSVINGIIDNTKKYMAGELKENILNLKSIIKEEVSNYFQK